MRTSFLGLVLVLLFRGVEAREAGESVREGGLVVSPMVLSGFLLNRMKTRGERFCECDLAASLRIGSMSRWVG